VATATLPTAATEHYLVSAALAAEAVQRAVAAQPQGVGAVIAVVTTYQAAAAVQAQDAVAAILTEQAITAVADALLNPLSFTSAADLLAQWLADVDTDAAFMRLIASLVQDAGRSAESVAVAARPQISYVRYLSPPSCARCAVLAGRIYRWSEGFLRHPNCDCVMLPTTIGAGPGLITDPLDLVEQGLVTGLSKADLKALADGADLNQVINVRRVAAGLREAGRVLARRGRLTPEGIYRIASDRTEAVALLRRFGYLR
jgi:hypothetical protein